MKIKVDREAKALYITISKKDHKDHSITPETLDTRIVVDYLEDGELYGIEILGIDDIDIDSMKTVEFSYID